MNRFVIPLIVTALLAIGIALFVSCDYQTPQPGRFVEEGVYTTGNANGCMLRTIRDKYTGCEYLMACNNITAMPHSCKVDDPNEYGMHP